MPSTNPLSSPATPVAAGAPIAVSCGITESGTTPPSFIAVACSSVSASPVSGCVPKAAPLPI